MSAGAAIDNKPDRLIAVAATVPRGAIGRESARIGRDMAATKPIGQPFTSAEEAWFWTVSALRARRENTRTDRATVARPCDPDDVVKCLDTLYRRRRVELAHARVLKIWGERGYAPPPGRHRQGGDWRLWREAIDRLEWPLRVKGIVA